MSTKILMAVEEYLHTSFDGSDCEYVEGEILERNMGQSLHGTIQIWLGHLLIMMAAETGIRAKTEVRIRIGASRYRIPDLSVWRKDDDIGDGIPNLPPFLAIEILSPDDRLIPMLEKIHEYLSIGVEWVWMIDPYQRKAMTFSRRNAAGEFVQALRTEDPVIELALDSVLNPEH